jgi:hypothetical protein
VVFFEGVAAVAAVALAVPAGASIYFIKNKTHYDNIEKYAKL